MFILRRIRNRIIRRIINCLLFIAVLAGLMSLITGCTDLGTEFPKQGTTGASDTMSTSDTSDAQTTEITTEITATEQDDNLPESFYTTEADTQETDNNSYIESLTDVSYENLEIPSFNGSVAYVEINNNVPFFDDTNISECFEYYSEKDSLGRCQVAVACIGKDTMPTEERGEIGHIRPSGWHTVKYNDIIEGNYLYNRCHLIGYQLTGENDNDKNLITGTRFMNVDGMLPFENSIADYIYSNPENHVLYRVTPVYNNNNLVASGVLLEAISIETDNISFCIYCYNNQPGITIDYASGDSEQTMEFYDEAVKHQYESVAYNIDATEAETEEIITEDNINDVITYVVNTNTGKFHKLSCESVDDIKDKNKMESTKSRDELINEGYSPCKRCNP